jgi:competence protein ComEA
MKAMRFSAILYPVLLLAATPLFSQDKLPAGPGKEALVKVCQGCHPTEIVAAKRHTREEWETVITNMVNAGATGTDAEFNQIADYLAEHFAKPATVNINKANVDALVEVLGIPSNDAGVIVQYREKNGPFQSLADLKKVPGLNTVKLDAQKEKIVFK